MRGHREVWVRGEAKVQGKTSSETSASALSPTWVLASSCFVLAKEFRALTTASGGGAFPIDEEMICKEEGTGRGRGKDRRCDQGQGANKIEIRGEDGLSFKASDSCQAWPNISPETCIGGRSSG
jgi:hypothetical protein